MKYIIFEEVVDEPEVIDQKIRDWFRKNSDDYRFSAITQKYPHVGTFDLLFFEFSIDLVEDSDFLQNALKKILYRTGWVVKRIDSVSETRLLAILGRKDKRLRPRNLRPRYSLLK